jgi:hypothetical protein
LAARFVIHRLQIVEFRIQNLEFKTLNLELHCSYRDREAGDRIESPKYLICAHQKPFLLTPPALIMTSVDDFSDCGHDIADVVNYRRALAQRLSIVMMELDIGSVQPEEVRTYLYICTLLQRLCRPASIILTPLGIVQAPSQPIVKDPTSLRDSAAVSNKRVCARARCKRYRQVTRFGTERSNCANAIARLQVSGKDDSGCSRFRLNCEALRSFANGIQIYEYMPHVCL